MFLKMLGVAGVFLVAWLCIVAGSRTMAGPWSPSSITRIAARRGQELTTLGFTKVSEREAHSPTDESFAVPPGGCFAVVVSALEGAALQQLEVRDARGALGTSPESYSPEYVNAVEWCSPRGGRFTVALRGAQRVRVARFEGTLSSHQGPVSTAIPNGEAALRDEIFEAPFVTANATTLVADLRRTPAVVLLPSTPATRAALGDAALVSASEVRQAPAPAFVTRYDLPDEVPTQGSSSSPQAPTMALFRNALSMVAVVDPGAFHRPCVEARFLRAMDDRAALYRVEVPGWRATPLAFVANVATDRRCAREGLAVYARVAEGSPSLQVALALDGPEDATITASPWRGEQAPHSLFARLQSACDAQLSDCGALSAFAFDALPAPVRPDLTASLRNACTRGHAGSCGRLALRVQDPIESGQLLRFACERDEGTACLLLGERARLGMGTRVDLPAARTYYHRACLLGLPSACEQRATFDLLQLAPS